MSTIDRAAAVLAQFFDNEGGMTAVDEAYEGDCTGLAEALADAGLLAPDLPEHNATLEDECAWEVWPLNEAEKYTVGAAIRPQADLNNEPDKPLCIYAFEKSGTTLLDTPATIAEVQELALVMLAAANHAKGEE